MVTNPVSKQLPLGHLDIPKLLPKKEDWRLRKMRIYLRSMRKLIEALFPKTRERILAATLMDPESWWYLSDLAKHLGVSPSSLQRELTSLVSAGILCRREEGNRVYFKADPDCPVLEDLQGLLTKTAGLADALKEALHPLKKKIQAAFVYGSIARGEEISGSDIDLLVVGEVGLSDLAPKLRKAQESLRREINPTVFTPAEFQKKRESHFLNNVMTNEKIFIIGSHEDLEGA